MRVGLALISVQRWSTRLKLVWRLLRHGQVALLCPFIPADGDMHEGTAQLEGAGTRNGRHYDA